MVTAITDLVGELVGEGGGQAYAAAEEAELVVVSARWKCSCGGFGGKGHEGQWPSWSWLAREGWRGHRQEGWRWQEDKVVFWGRQ
jgi:hypothetical protein